MGVFSQMTNIKDKVRLLLVKNPHLRDDDFKLIATFYYYEAGGEVALKSITGYDFLKKFSQGDFTHIESIRRVRAKLQEEYPELRGKNYSKRKKEGEDFAAEI